MKLLNNFLSYFNKVINTIADRVLEMHVREILIIILSLVMGIATSIYTYIIISIPFFVMCFVGIVVVTIIEYRDKKLHPNPDILAIASIAVAIILGLNEVLYTNLNETAISLFILGSYGTVLYITLTQLICYALHKRRIPT